ncbi:MAG: GMC oxidoreductase [Leeuwenhoekiella sp.]
MKLDVTYDLCVIGSGPAGIITTLEYAKKNPQKKVVLVEFGTHKSEDQNRLDDSIEIENTVNHHTPYNCTNKGLGGTSLTWGGRCVMYDEIDFLQRDLIGENCTWGLEIFKEAKQYMSVTADYFECGEPIFNTEQIQKFKGERLSENFVDGEITASNVERWSMPTRFGARYAQELESLPNLEIVEGFEARDFGEPDNHGEVQTLDIRRTSDLETFQISALKFVISAGTQESTRLLLRNTRLFKNLPSVPRALGKYYQCHLFGKIASIVFKGNPKKTNYGFLRNDDGTYIRRRIQFTTAFLKKKKLLNTAFYLDNPLYYKPEHKSGAMSFMYLAMTMPWLGNKLAPPAIAYTITKGKVSKVRQHIFNVIKDFPGSLIAPATIFYKRYLIKRKLPGIFLYNSKNRYALYFHSEQVPSTNNKMELGDDGEKLIIHYKYSDIDVDSVIAVHEELDTWLQKHNTGHLEYWYDKKTLSDTIRQISKDGIHQVGTTRMAESPEKGVVDMNLKLWGTSNIYVCSSSVFPTSGQANPTFLLGLFAARLATKL